MLLQIIIFITGAAILALELLASRIMTPYFGVSLYIWSGILSITLISLALGYWWGGHLAAGSADKPPDAAKLTFLFALMPPVAALALVLSCLSYPYLFYALARADLIVGAFIACITLLFIPLFTTSAMNPLLVALLVKKANGATGDAGAGNVFFISTIGSVAGVIITAFWMIPTFSNFVSVLLIAVTLAILPVLVLYSLPISRHLKIDLTIITALALVLSLSALIGADGYISYIWNNSKHSHQWIPEAEYRSMFGTVKILRKQTKSKSTFLRMYFQDGLVQNEVDEQNKSTTLYTYALEILARLYRPQLQTALVLGNGAGMVPMHLAAQGIKVTAVDIDPTSFKAAVDYFGYDPKQLNMIQADARTFLRTCQNKYDVIIMDLFHSDGVPDYLVTRDMFRDLKHCLASDGVAVFNTFVELNQPRYYAHFLATLRTELPHIMLYRPSNEGTTWVNSFVVAAAQPLVTATNLSHLPIKTKLDRTIVTMLGNPVPLNQQLLEGGQIIMDANNPVAVDIALNQLRYRRYIVANLPMEFFLN